MAIMCRLNKITCVKENTNTEDQELHMGEEHHYEDIDNHYEDIDDFIPRREATLRTAAISMNQSMEIMNQSTQRQSIELPSFDLSGTENQVTIHDIGHQTQAAADDASDQLSQSSNCPTLSGATENQVTIHDDGHQTQATTNDASEYLSPSVTLDSDADEDIPDQRIDEPGLSTENEVDIADNELNEDGELQEQEKTENEYVGLDKVAMEAEKILRRSDEDLYTLMDVEPSGLQAQVRANIEAADEQHERENESDGDIASGHQAQVGANIEAADEQPESEDESDRDIARSLEKKESEVKTKDMAEDCDTADGTNDDVAGSDTLEKKECEGKTKDLADDHETAEKTYNDVAGIFEGGASAVGSLPLHSTAVIGDDLTRSDEPDHTYLDVIGSGDDHAVLEGSQLKESSSDEDSCEYSYAYTGRQGKFRNRPEKSNRKVIIFKTIE